MRRWTNVSIVWTGSPVPATPGYSRVGVDEVQIQLGSPQSGILVVHGLERDPRGPRAPRRQTQQPFAHLHAHVHVHVHAHAHAHALAQTPGSASTRSPWWPEREVHPALWARVSGKLSLVLILDPPGDKASGLGSSSRIEVYVTLLNTLFYHSPTGKWSPGLGLEFDQK